MLKVLSQIQVQLNAPKNQFNSFGKYNYRSCEDILEGVKPLLKTFECILIVSDKVVLVGDRYYIEATATISSEKGSHSSTGVARESLTKKGMDDSQVTGGASSYARKYALNGLFAIDDAKDADYKKPDDPEVESIKGAIFNNDGKFINDNWNNIVTAKWTLFSRTEQVNLNKIATGG